jgi:acylphosphatase
MRVRAQVTFKGMVQGVFFRANATNKARELGVTGWVCNMRDGSVYALFEGEEEVVKAVIDWCSNSQPHARVDKTEIAWQSYSGEFQDFEIRH